MVEATKDDTLRRDLLVIVAELEEKRMGRAGEAEKVYARILAAEPLHAGAFRALTRLYRDGQRWPELRALLDTRQLAELDARERLDLLAQVAELDESALNDADHALARLREDAGAGSRRTCGLTARSIATTRRASAGVDLEALLGTRVGFASDTEVSELEFRRAELRASHLGDVAGALDLLEQIVKSAPNHEGARRLLEKLVAIPEHRQRVAAILEPVYEASGAWARLVAILEVQREPLAGRTAAAMLARIADLQENRLQAKPAALATWRQVLAVEPDNADALGEIERLGTALERFSELVDVYQELAFKRDAADIEGRADLLSRAAKLYAGRLGNRRAAIDVWKLVLNLDQNATATAMPAAAALETLYADTGDVAGLVKILRMQVRWAGTSAERKKILFRIAGLEEKSLTDTDAAVATLRAILEIDPQEREAIEALEAHLRGGLATTASASRCCASASTWPATRRRARTCGAGSRACSNVTSATSTRRSRRASASSTKIRPTIRRWRRWRVSTSSKGVTATGWRSSSGGWRWRRRARPNASACCARSRCCWKDRSAIPTTRSGAGARCWRRRPPIPRR